MGQNVLEYLEKKSKHLQIPLELITECCAIHNTNTSNFDSGKELS